MKMYFDTFAKHNPVNSEKYPRLLKENIFFCIFATPRSVNINALPGDFQEDCIQLQSGIQVEKKKKISLLDFYKPCLSR